MRIEITQMPTTAPGEIRVRLVERPNRHDRRRARAALREAILTRISALLRESYPQPVVLPATILAPWMRLKGAR